MFFVLFLPPLQFLTHFFDEVLVFFLFPIKNTTYIQIPSNKIDKYNKRKTKRESDVEDEVEEDADEETKEENFEVWEAEVMLTVEKERFGEVIGNDTTTQHMDNYRKNRTEKIETKHIWRKTILEIRIVEIQHIFNQTKPKRHKNCIKHPFFYRINIYKTRLQKIKML